MVALCLLSLAWQYPRIENVIQRALVMRHGGMVTANDLMLPVDLITPISTPIKEESMGHVEVKKRAEYQYILENASLTAIEPRRQMLLG